jgi:hypothetical protein
MGIHLSLGPVFAYEARRAVRGWHMYAHRSILGLALLAATFLVWHIKTEGMAANPALSARYMADGSFSLRVTSAIALVTFHVMVAIQLAFVFLLAPPSVAGTLCQDRLSGVLADMLASGLAAWEIVVGRLAARLSAVLMTIGCTIPITSALMLMGGIEVKTVIAAALVTTGVAILGSTLALALSVGRGKTHEVTLMTYAILGLVFFLDPLVVWIRNLLGWFTVVPPGAGSTSAAADVTALRILNPFWLVLAPYYQPDMPRLQQPIIFLAGSACVGLLLMLLSIATLRSEAAQETYWRWIEPESGRRPRKRIRPARSSVSLNGPFMRAVLEWNPVLWLELRSGAGRRRSRVIWLFYACVAAALMGLVIYTNSLKAGWGKILDVALANSIQISLGLLLLSIPAAASLGEDRANGTLAALLATPLRTGSIILGKWLGAFQIVPWLAIFPCLLLYLMFASPLDILLMFGLVLAYGAAVVSMGLYLATTIPNVGRAVGATVTTCALACSVIPILFNYSPDFLGFTFSVLVALFSIGMLAAWGLNLVATTWKGDKANAVGFIVYMGAFIAAAILLPPLAVVSDLVMEGSSVWIAATAFVAFLATGFGLTKNAAHFNWANAREFNLFVLFSAGLLPVLIDCVHGWDKGMKLASPWLAGRDMVLDARSGFPSTDHASWILFWIITFGAASAFLLRATHKSLDHHFERVAHS